MSGVSVCSVPTLEWHFGPTESKESSQSSVAMIYPVRLTGVHDILCFELRTDLDDGKRKSMQLR